MQAPASFVEKLESQFRGRLRIRWSFERNEWHIEQKIRRGMFPGTKPSKKGWDESIDSYVRHRDGVIHVMTVTIGDRMACPSCKHDLKVPFMVTHLLTCSYCKLIGKQSHVAAVYLPLNDDLIDYLKKIDPENPISERLAEDLDRQNEALAALMEADALRPAEAAFNDDFRRVVGIPTAHLSGRTQMWKG